MGYLRIGPDRAFMIAYGAAHGAKSLIWQASELLFAFFLTEAAGLPPSYVGLILALSLLANAGVDLTLGWAIRHRVASSQAAGRMQMIGATAAGATLVVFACVGFLPESLRLGFALLSILAFRCAYPFLDNPQNAILAFATGDDGGRARIASLRYVVSGSTNLMLAALFAPMMINAGAAVQSQRFWFLCIVLAVLAVATASLLHLKICRNPNVKVTGTANVQTRVTAGGGNGHLAAVAVFATAFAIAASMPVFSRLKPYFAAFAVREVFDAGLILSAAALGSLVSQFGWSRLAQSWRLVAVLRAALATTTVGAVLFYFGAKQGGAVTALCMAVYGIGTGGVMMSAWSLLAGVASAPGSVFRGTAAFGVYTCCSKLGHAASAGFVGLILAGLDYRSQEIAAGPIVAWMTAAPIVGSICVVALSTLIKAGDPSTRPTRKGKVTAVVPEPG